MLNPLIVWEPGVLVRYHGSLTNLHGEYRAYPCTCLNCNDPIIGTVQFQLVDDQGDVAVTCVRPRSITPAAGDGHADRIGPHRAPSGEHIDCNSRPL